MSEHQLKDDSDLFIEILRDNLDALSDMVDSPDDARYAIKSYSANLFKPLIEKYSDIPQHEEDFLQKSREITKDLYVGVPRWDSPRLEYNVGTSVNAAAAAAYSLALQQNVYNINDGLAGNTLIAEESVTQILAKLARLQTTPHGIFTFGGTATNLYAMKIGIKKANPKSSENGVGDKMKVFITEDAHFSHQSCAEWLGIGSKNVIILKTNNEGRTDLDYLKEMLESTIKDGYLIGGILVNGGTTYNHVIDDIRSVVAVRDQLAKDYNLDYTPHIHVDAVIGWIWLFFAEYNWTDNPLKISDRALGKIREQYSRIEQIRLADSWGVDFHKSIGGCPIDSSAVIINQLTDAMLLSRKASGISIHQLASEYSVKSPVDYTLETSRAAGAPLAALTALHTSGIQGYQKKLANLIEQSIFMRDEFSLTDNIEVCNTDSLGFVTILRILPRHLREVTFDLERGNNTEEGLAVSNQISKYTKDFFDWDYKNRVAKALPGPEFSFSNKYTTLSNSANVGVIKLYPVSPLFDRKYANDTVRTIIESLSTFEKELP